MVAEPRTWVDLEGAVRAWARDALPELNGRVFLGVNNRAAFPQIVIQRYGGPDDAALVQFDCWGDNVAQAAQAAAALATAADLMAYTSDDVVLKGAVVTDVRRMHDEDSDQPRYIVDMTISAWAAGLSS